METATATATSLPIASQINPLSDLELEYAARAAEELEARARWRSNPLTWFETHLQEESWAAWRAFLTALFAVPMDEEQLALYRKCTNRTTPQTEPGKEAWMIVGRRGGKSRVAAAIACFIAGVYDYSEYLAPGEVATVMVIANDRKQARTIMRYIHGFIDEDPRLSSLVQSSTKESIDLINRVVIEVHTASYRSTRSYTIASVICDEIAFWRSEDSANPDTEIIRALKPAMASIPTSMLIGISSPWSRKGVLYTAFQKHFGKDGDRTLVWKADTMTMNPEFDEGIIEEAYEEDASAASAEYGAEFRSDLETFILPEIVEACVQAGRHELAPKPEFRYFGFIDPSGGSSDSMTMAIAHIEDGRGILDLVREKKPPFSPEGTSKEFAEEFKRYGITEAKSDYYGGEWPREQFEKHGITVTTSEQTKSEIYLELLPSLNSGNVALLDNKRLKSQLTGLERRTARSGKDSVDHAPGAHDDVINSAAGALLRCVSTAKGAGILEAYRSMLEEKKAAAGKGNGHATA